MTDSKLKTKLNAYWRLMRLDKPIGILLLLWPTLWALWIASKGLPDCNNLIIFVVGTVLMRSAGCVMNDIADRNFDGLVERTKNRPLATKEVSVKEALILALVLSFLAFVLVLFTNELTIMLSAFALVLAASYPFTKRFIVTPQAYLGIAFGFGIPMAFAAQTGAVPVVAWLMLFANVCWSLAYDTQYAMVDRDDDIKIGIHSSALFFGRYDVLAIMMFYAGMLLILANVGWMLGLGLFYYLGLALAGCIAAYHYVLIRNRQKTECFKAFLHNNWLGMLIFIGIVLNYS